MACLVSISFFSMPLSAPKFSFKELQLRRAAPARVPSQAGARAATNLLAPCNLKREIFSQNQSSCGNGATPLDHFGELVSCCKNVSSCTHKTIIGYWVGPDMDDGWGFVEAFVNRTT